MTIKEFKLNCHLPIKEANLLVSFVLHKPLEHILATPEKKLTARQIIKLAKLTTRRLDHEPIGYLLGKQEFYGLEFKVNSHVLIPRPETEMIIDWVRSEIQVNHARDRLIIDVGTGSGCIAITLAKQPELKASLTEIYAIDISPDALKVAKANAKKITPDISIKFKQSSLLEPILKIKEKLAHRDLIICANLPYLTPEQIDNSPTIKHEPRIALESGLDGLRHYRELFRQAISISAASISILCEIDETQGNSISKLIKNELPEAQFSIKKDLGGYDRLAVIRL